MNKRTPIPQRIQRFIARISRDRRLGPDEVLRVARLCAKKWQPCSGPAALAIVRAGFEYAPHGAMYMHKGKWFGVRAPFAEGYCGAAEEAKRTGAQFIRDVDGARVRVMTKRLVAATKVVDEIRAIERRFYQEMKK